MLVVTTPDFGNTLNNVLKTRGFGSRPVTKTKRAKQKMEKITNIFLNYSAVNPKLRPGFLDISISNCWHVPANTISNMDAN